MPSKEEIEAIERIKYNDIAKPLYFGDLTICNIEDLEIVINLVERQQRELEQLEAEKTEVINYIKEEISTMGSGKGMFLVKTALGAVLEKIEKGK